MIGSAATLATFPRIAGWHSRIMAMGASALTLQLNLGTAVAQPSAAASEPAAPNAPSQSQPVSPPAGSSAPVDANGSGDPSVPASVTRPTPEPPLDGAPAGDISAEDAQAEVVPAYKSYFASLFSARLELGMGVPFGAILNEERDGGYVVAVYDDNSTKTASPTHAELHIGASLEVAPIRGKNVKLALRGAYLFTDVLQSATVGGGKYETKSWNGQLLGIHAGLFGPVLYFGKRWYGSVQVLVGPISGTLYPAPVGQQLSDVTFPSVDFGGWMLRMGPGFGYAFNKLLIGGDLLYSMANIALNEQVYTNVAKDSTVNVVTLNAYVGFHL